MKTDVRLRPAIPDDAPVCTAILNEWIDGADWMPRIHETMDIERHYREVVLVERIAILAETDRPCGFMAIDRDEGLVTALYLASDARGRGVGATLLNEAKALLPESVSLWTFVANTGARRFYAREGFREVRRTDGDNEEGLPDVLLRWRPEDRDA